MLIFEFEVIIIIDDKVEVEVMLCDEILKYLDMVFVD